MSPLADHLSFPYMSGVQDIDPWSVELYWVSFGSPAAFYVKQDGTLLGYVFGNRCRIHGLDAGSHHVFEVGVADQDGRCAERAARIEVQVGETLPPVLSLSDLPWQSATSGYLSARTDRSVSGASLITGGKRYAKGVGTHPSSRIVYDLKGIFTRLSGAVGIEDQNGAPAHLPPEQSGQAVFRILADGREVLAPVRMIFGQPAHPFAIDVHGVNTLELLVERPAEAPSTAAPHANWLELQAELVRGSDG